MATTMSRAEAKALNLRHYFTGEACRNGHVSQRYTQSGACYECIKTATYKTRAEYAATQAADVLRPEVRRFARETIAVRLRIPEEQAESIGAIVAGMLAVHFPTLVGSDRVVMSPEWVRTERVAGTCLATFLIHRDDLEPITEFARRAMQTFALKQQSNAQ